MSCGSMKGSRRIWVIKSFTTYFLIGTSGVSSRPNITSSNNYDAYNVYINFIIIILVRCS